jgi:hypothetical protein
LTAGVYEGVASSEEREHEATTAETLGMGLGGWCR